MYLKKAPPQVNGMWVVGIDVHGSVGEVEAATAEVAHSSPPHEDDGTRLDIPR